jgi:hypothetical protein
MDSFLEAVDRLLGEAGQVPPPPPQSTGRRPSSGAAVQSAVPDNVAKRIASAYKYLYNAHLNLAHFQKGKGDQYFSSAVQQVQAALTSLGYLEREAGLRFLGAR